MPIPTRAVDLTRVPATRVDATTHLTRITTGSVGRFRTPGLRTGRYRARVRATGCTPCEVRPFDLTVASPSADLGTRLLTPVALELQAVAVMSRSRDVRLAPDRNTDIVRDLPMTRAGTALDVLRNVPGVDVDTLVGLRGTAGAVVQINGRPSPLTPSQLRADVVERVEVIPDPSARDDPTGSAGFLDLVFKQRVEAEYKGSRRWFRTALDTWRHDSRLASEFPDSSRIRCPDDTDLLDPTPQIRDPLTVSRETTTTAIDPAFTQLADRRWAIRGLVPTSSRTFGRGGEARRDGEDLGAGDPGGV